MLMETNLDKSFLSGEEICKIIETCAKAGVVTLKCGPLELSYAPALNKSPNADSPASEPTNSVSNPENIIQVQINAEKEALEDEEIRTREAQILELGITDPLKYEELLAQGELSEAEELDQDD